MPITDDQERKILAGGLLVLACSLGLLASALAVAALDHMAISAGLCGPMSGHCAACFGAIACLAAAVGTAATGLSMLRARPLCGAAA